MILTSKIQKAQVVIDDIDSELDKYNYTKDNSNDYFYRQEIIGKGKQRKMKKIYLHQEIAERKYNRKLKSNECVDHINGDKNNCKRNNVRIVTLAQNAINKNPLSDNKTGFTGIRQNKSGLFVVEVGRKTVGKFETIEEALQQRIDYIFVNYQIDIYERVRTAAATKEIYI